MSNQKVKRNQTISFPSVNSTLGLVLSSVSFAIRRKVGGWEMKWSNTSPIRRKLRENCSERTPALGTTGRISMEQEP